MLLNSLSAFEHAVAMCGANDTAQLDNQGIGTLGGASGTFGATSSSLFAATLKSPMNNDFDVNDRLYNTSPIILDHNDTYVVDDSFMTSDMGSDPSRQSEANVAETVTRETINAANSESYFRPLAIPRMSDSSSPFGSRSAATAEKVDKRAEIAAAANASLRANAQNSAVASPSTAVLDNATTAASADNDEESSFGRNGRNGNAKVEADPVDDANTISNSIRNNNNMNRIRSRSIGGSDWTGDNSGSDTPSFDPSSSFEDRQGQTSVVVSALTRLLEENNAQQSSPADMMLEVDRKGGGVALTIYLPDGSPINISTGRNCDTKQVISQTLSAHKAQARRPALNYANTAGYELRLHEGDGEPDRDFPALDLTKKIVDYNVDEFCLCAVAGSAAAAGGGNLRAASFTGASLSPEDLPIAGGGSDPSSNNRTAARGRETSRDRYSSAAAAAAAADRDRDIGVRFNVGSDVDLQHMKQRALREDSFDMIMTSNSRNSTPSMPGMHVPSDYSGSEDNALEKLMGNAVYIIFPTGERLDMFFEPDMKMIELIPIISRTQRLRLYTDEYIFKVSESDRRRLKMMSPVVDNNSLVIDVGTFTFEIHKKVYADAGKRSQKPTTAPPHHTKRKVNIDHDRILFTDASANAYQEWNVVKKNKFGRKQERKFGIDGKKVYNAKRGQAVRSGASGGAVGVQRAERPISSIVKIEVLNSDTRTFRIKWMDEKDLYNIEYTCETTRDCYEIVQKIKYILNRNLPSGKLHG